MNSPRDPKHADTAVPGGVRRSPLSDEMLAEVREELIRFATAERDGTAELGLISVGPFTAFTMIGALQLAYRHPEMTPTQRETIRGIGEQIEPWFYGSPLAAVLSSGWELEGD